MKNNVMVKTEKKQTKQTEKGNKSILITVNKRGRNTENIKEALRGLILERGL